MPASIIMNQGALPAGVAGRAREDLAVSVAVVCTNATVEGSYLWVLEDVPIRSALVRGTSGGGASFSFTPDVKGTYRVSLQVNGSPFVTDNAVNFGAVLSYGAKTLAWRYPAAQEQDQEDNQIKTGLGFPGNVNSRGWATEKDLQAEDSELAAFEVINAVTTSPGPGVDRLVKLDPATGQLDATVIPGSAFTYSQLTGCTNEYEDILTVERVVGGFTFDGGLSPPTAHIFRMVGMFNNNAASGNARLRLYDLGAIGVPTAGVLRAQVSIAHTAGGATTTVSQTLVPTATPVGLGQIYDVPRQYEIRVYLDSVTANDNMTVFWGGIVTQ